MKEYIDAVSEKQLNKLIDEYSLDEIEFKLNFIK